MRIAACAYAAIRINGVYAMASLPPKFRRVIKACNSFDDLHTAQNHFGGMGYEEIGFKSNVFIGNIAIRTWYKSYGPGRGYNAS
jgi:hypothetical protein